MKRRRRYVFLLAFLAVTVSAVQFAFNPLGLGPEPERFLTSEFFENPLRSTDGVSLLVDGDEAFEAISRVIDDATTSIHVQTFIWKDDTIGARVATSLKAAAARGVSVTVSKDVLGTVFEVFDMLSGRTSPVYTRAGLRGQDNVDVRTDIFAEGDHSKYFIVDGEETIFGGMNIADEYHTDWHDYMVWIQDDRFARAFEARVLRGEPWPVAAPVVLAVNDAVATEIRTAMVEILDHATETIVLEHAYFSDDAVIDAVVRAAKRGVDVDVILPKEPDTHVYANRVTINRLLELGAGTSLRVLLYPRMMHSKVILVDGVVAAVGSANLTPRSMVTTKEITLFMSGTRNTGFVRELSRNLAADVAVSEPVERPFALSWRDEILAVAGKYVW